MRLQNARSTCSHFADRGETYQPGMEIVDLSDMKPSG